MLDWAAREEVGTQLPFRDRNSKTMIEPSNVKLQMMSSKDSDENMTGS